MTMTRRLRSPGWLTRLFVVTLACALLIGGGASAVQGQGLGAPGLTVQEYPVTAGSRPHDAVPDRFGRVWYAAQGDGTVGRLDPATGDFTVVRPGPGSAPHGVIMGPDDAAWITDGGLNAIVRVDGSTMEVRVFPLPGERANLNTATFDNRGILWYTGQAGYIGRLDPAVGVVQQWDAPRGRGPYGIATAPNGTVYFASLAGSYLGRIDDDNGSVTVLEPPTPGAGVRRVWADSAGRLWIAEYNAGNVGRYDPTTGEWREWRLPGPEPRPYAIYVDERDRVWLSDTALGGSGGADNLVLFDPTTEQFTSIVISQPSRVAQLGGVPGEIWGGERGRDHVVVVRYER
jgi:virginiamycin B lyase